jgi:flagellar hook assembly protein FlgD
MSSVTSTSTVGASTDNNKRQVSQSQKDFLNLFTKTLQNQDPTNPVSTAEYYATIATYYQVDAANLTNDKLEANNKKLDDILKELEKYNQNASANINTNA